MRETLIVNQLLSSQKVFPPSLILAAQIARLSMQEPKEPRSENGSEFALSFRNWTPPSSTM